MADGYVGLETLRGRLEATEGSAGTPTRLLYLPQGSVSIEHMVEQTEDRRGWAKFDGLADVYPEIQDVALVVDNAPWDYQSSPWWLTLFAASGGGTPTTVDTTAYQRDFTPSQTDATVGATGVRSAYLEYSADNFKATRVWQLKGMVGEELTINMRKRASGRDTGITWSGRFRSASKPTFGTAFLGSLSDYAITQALGQQFAAFLDSTQGALGSTAHNDIIEASFHFLRAAVQHDGAMASDEHTSMHRPDHWVSELSFTRKFSSTAEYDAYIGTAFVKTLRAVQLKFEGAQVGAVSAKNTFRLNFLGKYVEMGAAPVRRDGIWYQDFQVAGVYDATQLASWFIRSINNVSVAYTTT